MNESDIPIDIHCVKLLEWLISRRIVPKNFQIQIRTIRSKIANAINDMPENEELKKLLSGSHINYFHCKSIVEILKQTEKNTKSVFGTYSSQRMIDWQEIIKLYEKDNVYIGEAAQILIRYQTFEIPGLWKQIDKFEQQSDDALKTIKNLNKTESILKQQYNTLCQQIGIKGENLQRELLERVKELPEIYNNSLRDIKHLEDAIKLYSDFIKSSTITNLPILQHLVKSGNTTVYEYIHNEKPFKIEEPIQSHLIINEKSSSNDDNNSGDVDGIDFGDNGSGDNDTNSKNSAEVIDFSDLNISESDDVQLDNGGDIDWGITTTQNEESGTSSIENIDYDVSLDEYDIVVESGGMDGGIAKGEQAFMILDSPTYRDKFIDELYELESFLKLRHYELNTLEKDMNIMILFDNFSTYDSESIKKMLAITDKIIENVCSEQTQHLFQLKHSPKYIDIIITKFKEKLLAVDKIQIKKDLLKKKSIEVLKQKDDLKPIVNDLIEQTKVLQQHIENDISKRYKNRPVNLIGGLVK